MISQVTAKDRSDATVTFKVGMSVDTKFDLEDFATVKAIRLNRSAFGRNEYEVQLDEVHYYGEQATDLWVSTRDVWVD